jgi:hypothetical protein
MVSHIQVYSVITLSSVPFIQNITITKTILDHNHNMFSIALDNLYAMPDTRYPAMSDNCRARKPGSRTSSGHSSSPAAFRKRGEGVGRPSAGITPPSMAGKKIIKNIYNLVDHILKTVTFYMDQIQ